MKASGHFFKSRSLLVLAVLWFCVFYSGSFVSETFRQRFPFSSKNLILGLDLQGGTHVILEVDHEALYKEHAMVLRSRVRHIARQSGVRFRDVSCSPHGIIFPAELLKHEGFHQALKKEFGNNLTLEGAKICIDIADKETLLRSAVEKSIEIVRQRVDETGTREPLIQAQGAGRFVLEVPGVSDAAHVKKLLGSTAKLGFYEVVSTDPTQKVLGGKNIIQHHDFAYILAKEPALTGDMLLDAGPTFDENGRPQIYFKFSSQGSRAFSALTQKCIGRQIAIVLDNKILSAPVVQEPILGGNGVIRGNFSLQEAQDTSLLMRSGSLPAPLRVLEEGTIGPSLGADSIYSGILATFLALLTVQVMMFMAYGWFASFTNIVLVFFVWILLASLVSLGATLTLPGIAGIALSIGMAVDANVLINERIKEELASGLKIIPAIQKGYKRAWKTIFDSNMTTLIGAFLLYVFGTGPIRGFSVTVSLGIVISLFSSIFVSRLLVDVWLNMHRRRTRSWSTSI